jgi:hypothetical protein
MKAARQQAQDLEKAGTYLNAILTPDGIQEKASPMVKETNQPRQPSARVRSLRLEQSTRFAEPPAPPPQQPLPEKPDIARSSPVETSSAFFLKRLDTTKPILSAGNSPTNPQSSQILSLVEELSMAKKEIYSQGAKMKHLEEQLRQERSARESAEERARRLEQHIPTQNVSNIEAQEEQPGSDKLPSKPDFTNGISEVNDSELQSDATTQLQKRLDQMVLDMQRMSAEMEKFQQRAEAAENDASKARISLAEMISRLREQSPSATTEAEEVVGGIVISSQLDESEDETHESSTAIALHKHPSKQQANGHVRAPSRFPEHLEQAITTVLRDNSANGEILAQSGPYISMLGVVLIGVGLMAYLNSWQKTES